MIVQILIVDDDETHNAVVRAALAREKDYRVACVGTAREAKAVLAKRLPDLLLLDWKLPDGEGIDICRALRRDPESASLPIIMLTSMKAPDKKVAGLDTGADDYVAKPCDLAELKARVRAVLRRRLPWLIQSAPAQIGPLRLEPLAYKAFVDGKDVKLTKAEFEILYLLVANADRIVQRRYIESRALDADEPTDARALDVHLHHIREKLGPKVSKWIETSRGLGYIFSPRR